VRADLDELKLVKTRLRHHRQRRRARGRDRRARLLPAVARPPHRGDRAEGRRPDLGPLRRPARRARQPADAGHGAAAGLPRRPARAAAATSRRRWTG
jgi:hypothetical protein